MNFSHPEPNRRARHIERGDDIDPVPDQILRDGRTQGRTRDVEGDVATADDHHTLTQLEPVTQVDVEQEVDAVHDAV